MGQLDKFIERNLLFGKENAKQKAVKLKYQNYERHPDHPQISVHRDVRMKLVQFCFSVLSLSTVLALGWIDT